MNWFEHLTGFAETGYAETRGRLEIAGERLRSRVNGRSYGIGRLELVSLATLRRRVLDGPGLPGRLRCSVVLGDARALHRDANNAGALFQVASQFNLLEMMGPDATPEHGVGIYECDGTQGPACAIAAGAATIYRNYFVPVGAHVGQTAARQLDALADVGGALSEALAVPVDRLWDMRNGYALCTEQGLALIAAHLASLDEAVRDRLRGLLRIGLHSDVEVTDVDELPGHTVSQAFCSALPVAYCGVPHPEWGPFASLILEATYEATLWAAVANAQRGASRRVLLTLVGDGAFGNEREWIHDALRRALALVRDRDLEVGIVCKEAIPDPLRNLVREFA
jgi:hypothetical protein